jgi:hypothetical protein
MAVLWRAAIGHHAPVNALATRIALVAINKIIVTKGSRGIGRGRSPAMREGLEDWIGEAEVVVEEREVLRVEIHFYL